MDKTYNSILNEMKTVYFNISGENVDLLSDIGARFQAVASEIYSLFCYSDYVLKQAFPQTATGDYLDKIANLRGIERKKSTKAYGLLTFTLDEALTQKLTIPRKTICSVSGSPYIQFYTGSAVSIPAGQTQVSVYGYAMNNGSSYNVPAGTVNVIVNPSTSALNVTNTTNFTGGSDVESDESLQKRVCKLFESLPNGVSLDAIANSLLEIDEIIDCRAVKQDDNITFYVKTPSGSISTTLEKEINNYLYFAQLVNVNIVIDTPKERVFNLEIYGNISGDDENAVIENINNAVGEFCKAQKIGENLEIVEIIKIISDIDDFDLQNIYCEGEIELKLLCNSDEYLSLGSVKVNE